MIAIGRRIYGLAVAFLGGVEFAYGAFSADWLPVPAHLPGYHVLAYASAGFLIAAGLAISLPRRASRVTALCLAVFFAAWGLALLLPIALATPRVWVGWQGLAENTVMTVGAVLAFVGLSGPRAPRAAVVARAARLVFGLCLLVFGVSHFVYAGFTAALVPAWLPPSQLFWVWLTGAAQIAAGLAFLSGIQARLAAILLTVMYAVFGLLVQIPSIVAHPSHDNWAENAINLILLGAAWTAADSLARTRVAR